MNSAIISTFELGFPWKTEDPFLFCVYHLDHYPTGDGKLGPSTGVAGRALGSDFEIKDGFRMYHGAKIPGFPAHPHRGFETVTVVEQGMVDHSDSLGAAGRYGTGDTQWMTAGKGVQHAEMFPLLNTTKPNTLELFQIWLNLPAKSKFVDPHYGMMWREHVPVVTVQDDNQKAANIKIIAGTLDQTRAVSPPPNSWAADEKNGVCIWIIELEANAEFTIPSHTTGLNRNLYFYEGEQANIAGTDFKVDIGIKIKSDENTLIVNGSGTAKLLLMQGKPIEESVVQYGPFVMNNEDEIRQAYSDFNETHFGGWPWQSRDQTHEEESQRFAKFADGKVEKP